MMRAFIIFALCLIVVQASFFSQVHKQHKDAHQKAKREVNAPSAFFCMQLTCFAGPNEACNASYNCKPGYKCGLNMTCEAMEPPLQEGDTCDPNPQNDPCDPTKYLTCGADDGTCQHRHFLGAGESCTETFQCVPGIECVSGKCQGKLLGETCEYYDSCILGHYCSSVNNTCQADKPVGSECDVYIGECGYYGYCIAETEGSSKGKCGLPWTKDIDGVCFDDLGCDWAKKLYCKKTTPQDVTGVCQQIPTNTWKTCNDDANCTADMNTCQCNYGTGLGGCQHIGTQYNSTWKSLYTSFFSCGMSSLCPITVLDPGSCMYDKCKNNVGCFNHMVYNTLGDVGFHMPGCIDFSSVYTTCSAETSTTTTTAGATGTGATGATGTTGSTGTTAAQTSGTAAGTTTSTASKATTTTTGSQGTTGGTTSDASKFCCSVALSLLALLALCLL